ncbi:MAG TPA: toll/interleukin-1 receptor domain-containing protein, partial [Ktedonobacterales bacterium]
EANLHGADLSETQMRRTVLYGLDLRLVKGLETVQHQEPSVIDMQTLYKSQGKIPEVFLRGVGVPENVIESLYALPGEAFQYPSCFISYASQDQAFAECLYANLQAEGVRCSLAPEELKTDGRFWHLTNLPILLHDKLLVIFSEDSIKRHWLEDEVRWALGKEWQPPKRTILFPIRLDDAVMTTGHPWARYIRMKSHIGDFTHWKDHDAYQQAFARLLRDLQAEGNMSEG